MAPQPRTPAKRPWWRRPRPLTAVAALALMGATALFALNAPGAPGAPVGAPAPPSGVEEAFALGAEIYAANCASCHGPDGGGDPAAGVPALDGSMHAWHHPDSQIAGFLRDGVGRMPAVGAGWTDDEIGAVLAYVKQWWDPEQLAYQTGASRQNP